MLKTRGLLGRRLADRGHRIGGGERLLETQPPVAGLGAATGAGLDLALMCDLRYAARSAKFAETYVKLALLPGAGGAYFLPRIIGKARALEMLWTGDFIDGDEAERIGSASR